MSCEELREIIGELGKSIISRYEPCLFHVNKKGTTNKLFYIRVGESTINAVGLTIYIRHPHIRTIEIILARSGEVELIEIYHYNLAEFRTKRYIAWSSANYLLQTRWHFLEFLYDMEVMEVVARQLQAVMDEYEFTFIQN